VSTVSTGQTKTNRCCEQCGFVKLCTKTVNEKGKSQMLCLSCRLDTLKRCRELGLLRQNSRGFSLRGLFSKDKKKSSGPVSRSTNDLSASANNGLSSPVLQSVASTSSAPALLSGGIVNTPPPIAAGGGGPTLYEEPRSPDAWSSPDINNNGWNGGGGAAPDVQAAGGWGARDNFTPPRGGDGGSLKTPPSGHRPSKPLQDVSLMTGSYRPSQNNLMGNGNGGYPNPGDQDNGMRARPSQPMFGVPGAGAGAGGAGAGGGGGGGGGAGSPNWGRQPAHGMSFHPGAPAGGMGAPPRVRAQTSFDTRANGPPAAAPPYGGAAQPPFGGVASTSSSPAAHADPRDIYGQLSLLPAGGGGGGGGVLAAVSAAWYVYGQLNLNPQRY
jgi:hypothetical protein